MRLDSLLGQNRSAATRELDILTLAVALSLLVSSPSPAGDAPPTPHDGPALVIDQQPERYEGRWAERQEKPKKNKKRHNFARVVFWLGAGWDMYTTKHGLDAGLQEGNPFATPFTDNPNWFTLALPKLLAYTAFELVGRRGWTKTRDALLLSTGYAQMAVGFSNLDLLQAQAPRERDAPAAPPAPAPAPTPP
jgi:hypothetical protein